MMTPVFVVLATRASSPEPAAETVPPRHQLSVYVRSGASLYLSDARTQGGVGGGLGVRDTVDGRWLLQADVNALTGLGSALAVRVGAGIQRRGWCSPAAMVTLTGLFGERLDFFIPQHPLSVDGPALALGLTLAPLRFQFERTQVSVLELGLGVGTDRPGLGLLYGLTLLEVGVTF